VLHLTTLAIDMQSNCHGECKGIDTSEDLIA